MCCIPHVWCEESTCHFVWVDIEIVLFVSMYVFPIGIIEWLDSKDISLHEVELSSNNGCQQIKINPDSPLFISTGFLPRVSSKRMNLSET